MTKIEELEYFFELDLKAKKLIEMSRPNIYNLDPVDMKSNLLKSLNTERNILHQMVLYSKLDLLEDFDEIFSSIEEDINNCKDNELEEVYRNRILFLTPELVDSVKNNIVAGTSEESVSKYVPIKECRTVSDMLHYIHFYVSNNDKILKSVEQLDSKVINGEEIGVRLYGRENETAREIFNNLPTDEQEIIEVSFKDHVLIMVRDRGHALTMDIQNEPNDNYRISYFIPKVCNINMVNNLKGVTKLDPLTGSIHDVTSGEFVAKKDELTMEINNFIKSVPTDDDIYNNRPFGELKEFRTL